MHYDIHIGHIYSKICCQDELFLLISFFLLDFSKGHLKLILWAHCHATLRLCLYKILYIYEMCNGDRRLHHFGIRIVTLLI